MKQPVRMSPPHPHLLRQAPGEARERSGFADGTEDEEDDNGADEGEGDAAEVEVVHLAPAEGGADEAANDGANKADDNCDGDAGATAPGRALIGDELCKCTCDEAKCEPSDNAHRCRVKGRAPSDERRGVAEWEGWRRGTRTAYRSV